ncbi:MAG: MaoC family dehydratase [Ramlibacter sp.]|nr:MaoC family dehydratase [Ramlibacter sp.]
MSDAALPPSPPVAVGHRFSREHQFTPEQVRAFSSAAGDTNPIHHDAALAAGTRFGGLIASGTHSAALLLGLTASHFSEGNTVVGLGFTVSFLQGVPADATVVSEWTVTAVRPHKGGPAQVVEMTGEMRDTRAGATVYVRATGQVLVGVRL